MYKVVLLLVAILSSNLAMAANVNTPNTGTITKITAYTEYGGGDVILFFTTGLSACPDAVYLSSSSPGFKTVLSLALTAYTTKQKVYFGVLDDQIFAGGQAACKVDSIRFVND